jgi:hypothetical protein
MIQACILLLKDLSLDYLGLLKAKRPILLAKRPTFLAKHTHTFGVFSKIPYVHNLYLEVLTERGGLGFAAFGVLIGSGLAAAWRLQRVASGDVALLGAGALAGLVGLCSAAVVDLTFVHQWVAIILFVLLGIITHLCSITQDSDVKQ